MTKLTVTQISSLATQISGLLSKHGNNADKVKAFFDLQFVKAKCCGMTRVEYEAFVDSVVDAEKLRNIASSFNGDSETKFAAVPTESVATEADTRKLDEIDADEFMADAVETMDDDFIDNDMETMDGNDDEYAGCCDAAANLRNKPVRAMTMTQTKEAAAEKFKADKEAKAAAVAQAKADKAAAVAQAKLNKEAAAAQAKADREDAIARNKMDKESAKFAAAEAKTQIKNDKIAAAHQAKLDKEAAAEKVKADALAAKIAKDEAIKKARMTKEADKIAAAEAVKQAKDAQATAAAEAKAAKEIEKQAAKQAERQARLDKIKAPRAAAEKRKSYCNPTDDSFEADQYCIDNKLAIVTLHQLDGNDKATGRVKRSCIFVASTADGVEAVYRAGFYSESFGKESDKHYKVFKDNVGAMTVYDYVDRFIVRFGKSVIAATPAE